jgi:hypothetical protein
MIEGTVSRDFSSVIFIHQRNIPRNPDSKLQLKPKTKRSYNILRFDPRVSSGPLLQYCTYVPNVRKREKLHANYGSLFFKKAEATHTQLTRNLSQSNQALRSIKSKFLINDLSDHHVGFAKYNIVKEAFSQIKGPIPTRSSFFIGI